MRIALIILLKLAILHIGYTQTCSTFFVNSGIGFQNVRESRFTSTFRSGISYNFVLGYEKKKKQTIRRFSFLFTKADIGKSNILYTINLQPQLKYEYLKSLSNSPVFIGGYVDLGILSEFRIGSYKANNLVSYVYWNSIGVSAQYNKSINSKLIWESKLSFPIVSYRIRPSYATPLPDEFLNPDRFNIQGDGIVTATLLSGELRFIPNFSNIYFSSGLYFRIKNSRWHFGLLYAYSFMHTSELKPIINSNNYINVTFKKS